MHHFAQLGGNFRIDALQAALLGVLLPHVRSWIVARRELARTYTESLRGAPGIATPLCCNLTESAWGAYSIRAPQFRDELAAHLRSSGIETAIYYPLILAEQPLFAGNSKAPAVLGQAVKTAREIVSLPIFPGLTPFDQNYVVSRIRQFCQQMV